MKKGFTLVEMLIVVVVLVTLMSITFRLSSVGDDQTRRNNTIARMQRLENCLSGYYAAFGTYPPVRLHGSRDYNYAVNSHGFQTDTENKLALSWYTSSGNHGLGTTAEIQDWKQVRAACLSQPLAARFPVADGYNDYIEAQSELAKERLQNGEDSDTSAEHVAVISAGYDDGYTKNPGRHDLSETDWRESQLFQFGVMSYLLPRYLVMMNGDQDFFVNGKQWSANNNMPANPLGTGATFGSWYQIKLLADRAKNDEKEALATIVNIPSQAACARWMANLEKSCICKYMRSTKVFGINIEDSGQWLSGGVGIFAPGGSSSNATSDQYVLGMITITDGWDHEFYYYSPPPHQSYTVWSAGANGRTFPPWVDRSQFNGSENKCIGVWVDDDVIHMSN